MSPESSPFPIHSTENVEEAFYLTESDGSTGIFYLFRRPINGGESNGFMIRGHVDRIEETPMVIPTAPDIAIAEAVELSFPTHLGYSYQVQSSFDLQTWTKVGTPLLGTGEPAKTFVRKPEARPAFYRAEIANSPPAGAAVNPLLFLTPATNSHRFHRVLRD